MKEETKTYDYEEIAEKVTEYLGTKDNDNTKGNYKSSLNYFLEWFKTNPRYNEVNSNNYQLLFDTYKVELTNAGLSSETVNVYLTRIATFFNYCLKLPVKFTKAPTSSYVVKSLSKEEIGLLVDNVAECFSKSYPDKALRVETMIKFLFYTGFRISEALNLTLADIDKLATEGIIKYHGKGYAKNDKAIMKVEPYVAELITDYLSKRSVTSDYVFSNMKGKHTEVKEGVEVTVDKPISRIAFNKEIKTLAKYVDTKEGTNLSEVVDNNTSHIFRHSLAVHLLRVEKEDIEVVRQKLRHKSITTTQKYLIANEEAISNASMKLKL